LPRARPHYDAGSYLVFLGRIAPQKRVDRAIAVARRAGLPLKTAAKVDAVDRAYFAAEIEPLLAAPGIEYLGEDRALRSTPRASPLRGWRRRWAVTIRRGRCASSEVRCNPTAYHNGSVWPHDVPLLRRRWTQRRPARGQTRRGDVDLKREKKSAPRAGEDAARRISQANTGEVVRVSTGTASQKAAPAGRKANAVPNTEKLANQ
jgi:glycosyltransferase involved in cell wall biosynthesis